MKFNRNLIFIFFLLFSSASLVTGQDQDFQNSLELFQNRLYFLAHQKLLRLVDESLKPDVVEQAYYYSALCSFHLSQYKNAISEFTSLLINFPNTSFLKKAKYFTALSYFYLKNYTYAIKNLKNYVLEFPEEKENTGIRLLLAQSYLFLDYTDTALDLLKEIARSKDLKNEEAQKAAFFTGLVFLYNKDLTQALKTFKDLLLRGNDKNLLMYAHFYYGLVNFFMKKKEDAERSFKLVEGSKDSKKDLANMARFYLYLMHPDEKDLAPLLQEKLDNPLDTWVNLLLVQEYEKSNKDEDLLKALEKGLEYRQNTDLYYRCLYQYYLTQNDLEKGQVYLEKLLGEYPDSQFAPEARFNLGLLFFQEKDYSQAEKYFQDLTDQNPGPDLSFRVLYYTGEIQFAQKDYTGAITSFQNVLQMSNENGPFLTPCQDRLSDLYLLTEDHRKNIDLLSRIRDRDLSPGLKYKLAYSYNRVRETSLALKVIQDILDNSQDPEINYKSFLILHEIATNTKNEKVLGPYVFSFKENKFVSPSDFVDFIIDLAGLNLYHANYQDSIDNLLQAITSSTETGQRIRINRLLYENYSKLKLWDKARSVLDTLMKLDPGNEEYPKEKERIKEND